MLYVLLIVFVFLIERSVIFVSISESLKMILKLRRIVTEQESPLDMQIKPSIMQETLRNQVVNTIQ